MAEHWTCPRCEGLNGAGIAVCDGFGEDPHEDVWMIDVLRGETKEAEATAERLRAALEEARRELADQRDRTRTAAGDAYDFGQLARQHREAFMAFLSDMPPELLEDMAAAVERGERDLFSDAEGPIVIPLWLAGMADRVREASQEFAAPEARASGEGGGA